MIAAFCRFFIYLCDGSILAWGFWGPKNFLVLWRIAFPAPEYATDDAAHISIKLDLRSSVNETNSIQSGFFTSGLPEEKIVDVALELGELPFIQKDVLCKNPGIGDLM